MERARNKVISALAEQKAMAEYGRFSERVLEIIRRFEEGQLFSATDGSQAVANWKDIARRRCRS